MRRPITAKKWSVFVSPSIEKSNSSAAQPESEASVQGILLALRYLSREAEGAGLKELAITLKEAEVKCGRAPNAPGIFLSVCFVSTSSNREWRNAITGLQPSITR